MAKEKKSYISEKARERESKVSSVIYHTMFNRRLPIHFIFFKKNGMFLLFFVVYSVYVMEVDMLKSMAILLFGVIVISKYFMYEKFHLKNNVAFYNFKNLIMEKQQELDRQKGLKRDWTK